MTTEEISVTPDFAISYHENFQSTSSGSQRMGIRESYYLHRSVGCTGFSPLQSHAFQLAASGDLEALSVVANAIIAPPATPHPFPIFFCGWAFISDLVFAQRPLDLVRLSAHSLEALFLSRSLNKPFVTLTNTYHLRMSPLFRSHQVVSRDRKREWGLGCGVHRSLKHEAHSKPYYALRGLR